MEKKIENIVKHSEVSEKAIEKYLCERMKAVGYPCLKYSNANMAGYPDRVIVLPTQKVVWVELKSKGKKPSKIQQVRFDELRRLGHQVWIADSRQKVDEIVNNIMPLVFVEDYSNYILRIGEL